MFFFNDFKHMLGTVGKHNQLATKEHHLCMFSVCLYGESHPTETCKKNVIPKCLYLYIYIQFKFNIDIYIYNYIIIYTVNLLFSYHIFANHIFPGTVHENEKQCAFPFSYGCRSPKESVLLRLDTLRHPAI